MGVCCGYPDVKKRYTSTAYYNTLYRCLLWWYLTHIGIILLTPHLLRVWVHIESHAWLPTTIRTSDPKPGNGDGGGGNNPFRNNLRHRRLSVESLEPWNGKKVTSSIYPWQFVISELLIPRWPMNCQKWSIKCNWCINVNTQELYVAIFVWVAMLVV